MFTILSYQRSGTHLLAHLLNSHPDLKCYDEIYLKNKRKRRGWQKKYLLEKKPIKELGENEGCIIMYSTLLRIPEDELKIVRNNHIIHLVRTDLEKHIDSLYRVYGQKYNSWQFRLMREYIARYRSAALSTKFKFFFPITYESICDNKEITEYENKHLMKFLGVKNLKLTTDLPK